MSARVPFVKYSGAGNDFILIDQRSSPLEISPDFVRQLCSRRTGIHADGVIFLEEGRRAPYRMRVFNADGSEAEMCGNGIRCLTDFVRLADGALSPIEIETKRRVHLAKWDEEGVAIAMGEPAEVWWNLELHACGRSYCVHYLDTGVPHLVHFVVDIERVQVEEIGRALRHHSALGPRGANVTFAERRKDVLYIRTYERGVEGETLACGTGVTAAALACAMLYEVQSPIPVYVRSGDVLQVTFACEAGDRFVDVWMKGPVARLFEGVFLHKNGKLCSESMSV